MANRQVVSVDVIIDSPVESEERTLGYVVSALKNACRNIRDGTVLVVIRNDQDKILGVDLSGSPSEELQDTLEDLMDKLEQHPHVARVEPAVPRPPPRPQAASQT